MNRTSIYWALAGLVCGVIFTLLVGMLCVHRMMWRAVYQDKNIQRNSSHAIDAHFIEQMIPHHDDAIRMAALAKEKAEHKEIRELADAIMQAQTQENEQMKQWYRVWFGREVPTYSHGGHGMMNTGEDLIDLSTAKPFDKAFIEQMIPHHEMAVMMAQMLSQSTTRPEMKTLAESIIKAQTEEINAMREWYQQWY